MSGLSIITHQYQRSNFSLQFSQRWTFGPDECDTAEGRTSAPGLKPTSPGCGGCLLPEAERTWCRQAVTSAHGPLATWQGTRTKSVLSSGADIYVLIRQSLFMGSRPRRTMSLTWTSPLEKSRSRKVAVTEMAW